MADLPEVTQTGPAWSFHGGRDDVGAGMPQRNRDVFTSHTTQLPCHRHPPTLRVSKSAQTHENTSIYTQSTIIQ